MKKIALTLFLIFAMVMLFLALGHSKHRRVVATGNTEQSVIPFQPGQYQCAQYKMPVQPQKFSAEGVIKNGKTWFFDDIGCMALWLGNQPFKKSATVRVYPLDTRQWINGRQAWYTQWAQTPMGYGFAALMEEGSLFSFYLSGMLNGLLPCGFVYFFAVTAASVAVILYGFSMIYDGYKFYQHPQRSLLHCCD